MEVTKWLFELGYLTSIFLLTHNVYTASFTIFIWMAAPLYIKIDKKKLLKATANERVPFG